MEKMFPNFTSIWGEDSDLLMGRQKKFRNERHFAVIFYNYIFSGGAPLTNNPSFQMGD